MKLKHLVSLVAIVLLASCGEKKAKDDLADTGRTERTETLLTHIKQITSKGVLIGQLDATLYGIGWEGDSCRSDIKNCTDEMPIVAGFEIGGVEKLKTPITETDTIVGNNIYGLSFELIRKGIKEQYDRNGICILTWHLSAQPKQEQIDRVCEFLKSLVMPYGVRVPVVLCPYLPRQNKAFWTMLNDRIHENEVVNALLAYKGSAEGYPGDDIIDIIANEYYSSTDVDVEYFAEQSSMDLDKAISALEQSGSQHGGKPVALIGCGQKGVVYDKWYTEVLLPALERHSGLSMLLFGRNDNNTPGNYYVPFPGHAALNDFVTFYNNPRTLFLTNVNGLYVKDEPKEE